MIIFLYNESDQTLTLTSEDCTQCKIITRDNDNFDKLLKLAQDPESDWSDVEPLLTLDYFSYSTDDISIYIEDGNLLYDFAGSKKEIVPIYIQNIIKNHRFEFNFKDKMEAISFFLKRREFNKINIDDFMSDHFAPISMLTGDIIKPCTETEMERVAIDSIVYAKNDGKGTFNYKTTVFKVATNDEYFCKTFNVDFVYPDSDFTLDFKIKCENFILKFWKSNKSDFDEERCKRASKNRAIKDKFKSDLLIEFAIFNDDVLEILTTYMYSYTKFYEFFLSINPEFIGL